MIALDHLVVACRTLALGRDWCATTFGVAPETGGRHPSMGTHNAVLNVSSTRFPASYLELIAIDPDAPSPSRRRWFDLDALTWEDSDAPRLVHWVARTDDIVAASAALRRTGFDPGPIVAAERTTPRGLLRWRITLPGAGRRPSAGAMPLWIQWASEHPAHSLPASGVAIESLEVGGIANELAARLGSLVRRADSSSPLTAVLAGRRGRVTLTSPAPIRLSA